MAIKRDDSQQTTANLSVVIPNGEHRHAVSVSCHIRPNKGASINVDVLDATIITDDNRAELGAAVTQYIAEELAKAASLGIPVATSSA